MTLLHILRELSAMRLLPLIRNSRGATAIEYGLIATMIAIAAIGAFRSLGSSVQKPFQNVSSQLI
jgi:pilus assembly protein Flp/PilA